MASRPYTESHGVSASADGRLSSAVQPRLTDGTACRRLEPKARFRKCRCWSAKGKRDRVCRPGQERGDWPVGVARRCRGRLVLDDLHEGLSGPSVRRGGKGSALCASRRTQMPILMPILIPRERHGVKTGAGHDLRDGPWRYRRRATSHCRRIPLNGLVAP